MPSRRPAPAAFLAVVLIAGGLASLACGMLLPKADLRVYNDGDTPVRIELDGSSTELEPGEWGWMAASHDKDHEVRAIDPDGTVRTATFSTHRGSEYRRLRMFQAAGEACWALVDVSSTYGNTARPLQIERIFEPMMSIEHGAPFCPARTQKGEAVCKKWGTAGNKYFLPGEELEDVRVDFDEEPIVYRLMELDCGRIGDAAALAKVVEDAVR